MEKTKGLQAASLLLVLLLTASREDGAPRPQTVAKREVSGPVTPAPPAAAPGSVNANLLRSRRLVIPVEGVKAKSLRDTFTETRSNNRVHQAIDIMAPRGTPVLAADDGKVVKLTTNRAGGLTLYQVDASGRLSYYYAHLHGYAPGVHEGMEVRRGQVLGYVGTTGNAPETAPHLHFAVYSIEVGRRGWRGEPINPYESLVEAETVADAGAVP